ncbi:cytochrome oxidase putative small subunit CydP [Oceanospirillum sanctuarii]|uniref:cytochrome oxidase putative small subunit CydP n=1 Tax=Oceanospirillum sanctuarii TaxID=1434821 RepID=UPI000A375023|nr:cytochrome oxidase putative small subunit CydP [Oceanospirillum sanctuarii]
MQRNTLFVQTKRAFGQRWKTSLFARQKLVRELSIVLLIKLVLLYGIINFVVPSASVINDSDVSTRLLNPQLPASEQTSADASGSAPRSTATEADLLKAATSEPTASTQRETP